MSSTRPELYINGRNRYAIRGEKGDMPRSGTITKHIDAGDNFHLLKWAASLAVETGDPLAFQKNSQNAMDIGTDVHKEIEDHISAVLDGVEPPFWQDNSMLFQRWYSVMNELVSEWIAAEYMTFHPKMRYGGTIDAIARIDGAVTILDWKTTTEYTSTGNEKTFDNPKHAAQLGSYYACLKDDPYMENPTKAKVVYLYKDTGNIQIKNVNLDRALKVFEACYSVYSQKGGLFINE